MSIKYCVNENLIFQNLAKEALSKRFYNKLIGDSIVFEEVYTFLFYIKKECGTVKVRY